MTGKHNQRGATGHSKVLLFSIIYLFTVSTTTADQNSHGFAGSEYIESPTFSISSNLSEPQPYAAPDYPTNIMSRFGWAQGGNSNYIPYNQALSYSFTVVPGTAIEDFNVSLSWNSRAADLDIDFGRWDSEQNFISLIQSISNTGNLESLYIPRLPPGTYSIVLKSNVVKSTGVRLSAIANLLAKKRSTPFTIKWIGKSIGIKTLNIRAKLEGPYDNETGLMNDTLRTLGLIPEIEPYFLMSWGGDGETIDATDPDGVLSVTGNDAIVDWIKVQLYDYTFEGFGYVDSRSALLQRDGDIVDINGGPVQFWNLPSGNEPYYVAIQHRNHSTIITDEPYLLGADQPTLDFTLSSTILLEDERNPSRKLVNGEWILWSGDVIRNGAIGEEDHNASLEAQGLTGYLFEDVNLDGVCDKLDSEIILNNQGKWDWG